MLQHLPEQVLLATRYIQEDCLQFERSVDHEHIYRHLEAPTSQSFWAIGYYSGKGLPFSTNTPSMVCTPSLCESQ